MKMAAKKTKAKKLSPKKGVDIWSYYNLPKEILQLLRSNRRTKGRSLHYVTNTCSTKSWIPATSRCIRSSERRPEIYLLSNSSNTSFASTRQKYFYGHYQFQKAATDGRRIMVYSVDESLWIRYECATIDPFDPKKKCIEFNSVVGFQRKFYALSLQGALAVIEIIDSRLTVAYISTSRTVPSEISRFFREYLIEIEGEILLIFLIHKKTFETVDKVEVLRLCSVKFKWINVERLGGKTVFLDRRCSWVNSAGIGCRDNCIYFTQCTDGRWWIYDMESCCILGDQIKILGY